MPIKFNSPQETLGYVGNGALLVSALDENDNPTGGWRNLGQISSAVVALTSEKIELADTMQGTLSTAQSLVIRNTAELTATLKSFSPENLALALYGETILDEEQSGATFSFDYKPDSIEVIDGIIDNEVTITRDSDGSDVTDEFVINSGSVYAKDNEFGVLSEGEPVTVNYTKAKVKRVEGFVSSSKNVALVFDGFNIANQDFAVKVTYHKVALDPAAQRQLISTDFAEQELKGTLLASNAINGTGLSKLFKEEHQQ